MLIIFCFFLFSTNKVDNLNEQLGGTQLGVHQILRNNLAEIEHTSRYVLTCNLLQVSLICYLNSNSFHLPLTGKAPPELAVHITNFSLLPRIWMGKLKIIVTTCRLLSMVYESSG